MLVPSGVCNFLHDNLLRESNFLIIMHKRTLLMKQVHRLESIRNLFHFIIHLHIGSGTKADTIPICTHL